MAYHGVAKKEENETKAWHGMAATWRQDGDINALVYKWYEK